MPVYVGGTGRSGTSIVGKLISEHRDYVFLPLEFRFHTEAKGICDLLSGRATSAEFISELRGKWFRRGANRDRGLCRVLDESLLQNIATKFEEDYVDNPLAACQSLLRAVLYASGAAGKSWVETTPTTVERAATLRFLQPDAKFIHMVRDGRDVAASVTPISWGPSEHVKALRWWATRLRRAYQGSRDLPEGSLLELSFEDLLLHQREASYHQLIEFLGIEDDPHMRSFFDKRMRCENANIGRWARDIPSDEHEEFLSVYETYLHELHDQGHALWLTTARASKRVWGDGSEDPVRDLPDS